MLGSSSSSSSAQSSGASASGLGEFAPTNNISLGSSFPNIDLTEPAQIAGLAFVLFAAWLAWKRFK